MSFLDCIVQYKDHKINLLGSYIKSKGNTYDNLWYT